MDLGRGRHRVQSITLAQIEVVASDLVVLFGVDRLQTRFAGILVLLTENVEHGDPSAHKSRVLTRFPVSRAVHAATAGRIAIVVDCCEIPPVLMVSADRVNSVPLMAEPVIQVVDQ